MPPKKVKKFLPPPTIKTINSKLTKDDVTCPICCSICIKPITFPCNHTLCKQCYETQIELTSLCCPFCRLRIATWARKSIKEDKLINVELWQKIQDQFSDAVQAKLDGDSQAFTIDDNIRQNGDVDEDNDYSQVRDGIMSTTQGEIREDLNNLLKIHEEDLENKRRREAEASMEFIRKLQEEEEIPEPPPNTENDYEFAKRLDEEERCKGKLDDDELQVVDKRVINKKTDPPIRNLSKVWAKSSSSPAIERKRRATISSHPSTSKKVKNESSSLFTSQQPTSDCHITTSFLSPQPAFLIPSTSSVFAPATSSSQQQNVSIPNNQLRSSSCAEILQTNGRETLDSINAEVNTHFRPIKSAPKTPPQKRADGSYLPEPKLVKTTAIRVAKSLSFDDISNVNSMREENNNINENVILGISENQKIQEYNSNLHLNSTSQLHDNISDKPIEENEINFDAVPGSQDSELNALQELDAGGVDSQHSTSAGISPTVPCTAISTQENFIRRMEHETQKKTLAEFKARKKQEMDDLAIAKRLQYNINRGMDYLRTKESANRYSLRNWSKLDQK